MQPFCLLPIFDCSQDRIQKLPICFCVVFFFEYSFVVIQAFCLSYLPISTVFSHSLLFAHLFISFVQMCSGAPFKSNACSTAISRPSHHLTADTLGPIRSLSPPYVWLAQLIVFECVSSAIMRMVSNSIDN